MKTAASKEIPWRERKAIERHIKACQSNLKFADDAIDSEDVSSLKEVKKWLKHAQECLTQSTEIVEHLGEKL